MTTTILAGARLFDGTALADDMALAIAGSTIAAVMPGREVTPTLRLPGGILSPGFVDLQVNGGGGVMLDGGADARTLATICGAHARLGATSILPTLITATPADTAHVIALAIAAARAGLPGFLGLHLEGPHLDAARAGAHDPGLIRAMTDADLSLYLSAVRDLPALAITLSPRAATLDQIARLSRAGVRVFLGHTDGTADEAEAAFAAGAIGATHLYNAMSQMTARAPGLVGAVLAGRAAAGIIADGHHVVPQALRIALAARAEGLFLVSDSMAVAGSDLSGFDLGGRAVARQGGRLTLADGTLAGADVMLARAVQVLTTLGTPLARALAMATGIPAGVIGAGDRAGRIAPGRMADLVHLDDAGHLRQVWRAGVPLL